MDEADMFVFAKMSADQIDRLADAFGESMLGKAPSTEKIRDIVGGGLEESDVRSITHWLYIFCLSKISRADLHRWAESSSLGRDKTSAVSAAIDKICDRADVEKIRESIAKTELSVAGRPREQAAPASDDDKLTGGERQSREFLSMVGLKPQEGPAPTIRGMLADYVDDVDAVELVREGRCR